MAAIISHHEQDQGLFSVSLFCLGVVVLCFLFCFFFSVVAVTPPIQSVTVPISVPENKPVRSKHHNKVINQFIKEQ